MAERVVVIGGGIIGCTAAALLAEADIDVTLVEATGIGAGASGRNSGTVQHPFDPVLLELHEETLEAYHALTAADPAFAFPSEPVGVLLLTDDLGAAAERAAELGSAFPDLVPDVLDPAATTRVEPSLAAGWGAVRIATGYPVIPEAATHAMAARAMRGGATIRIGRGARPWSEDGAIRGVALDDGERLRADAVLAAGGPWTPELLDRDPAWPPIARTWGVTIQVAMADPPRHVLEEGVVHTINIPSGHLGSLFSLVTADGVATIGSTFLTEEPDPDALAPILLERGAAFVPTLASAEIRAVRMCARPQSADGRPFIGPVPDLEGLWVCAGHGPWGLSTGPASAALVVQAMLGRASRIPAELRSERAV